MSNSFSDYVPEEEHKIEDKDYKCFIESAVEKESKSGNPMIRVCIQLLPSKIAINDYFVKNQYFNRNITRLFDCFGIDRGDFELEGWKNAVGGVHVIRNEDGYLKIGRYLSQDQQAEIQYNGELPERATINKLEENDDIGLPF